VKPVPYGSTPAYSFPKELPYSPFNLKIVCSLL
jgi:hypothetical protein